MQEAVVAVLAGLALVGFHPAYQEPGNLKWIGVGLLAAVTLLQSAQRLWREHSLAIDSLDLWVIGLLGYAAASLLWSPDPAGGSEALWKAAACAVIFVALKNTGGTMLLHRLCVAVTASLAVVLVFVAMGAGQEGGFFNENFLTEFLLLGLPFGLAAVAGYRPFPPAAWALTAPIVGYLVIFNGSKIEFFVLPIMAFAVFLLRHPRRSRRRAALALGGLLAALPLVAGSWDALTMTQEFHRSIWSRLGLWFDTGAIWVENPLFGSGAGAFPALFHYFQHLHLAALPVSLGEFKALRAQAGAAHNDYLEYLADFGIVGTLLAIGFFICLGKALRRQLQTESPANTALVLAGIGATLIWMLEALIEFPLQNAATALLAIIGLAFLAQQARPALGIARVTLANPARVGIIFLLISAAALIGNGLYRYHLANLHVGEAARAWSRGNVDAAYRETIEAYLAYPLDTITRRQLFVLATLKTDELTPPEADQLFAIAMSAGPSSQLLLMRVQYLLSREPSNEQRAEIEQRLAELRQRAPEMVYVWIADGYWALLQGDRDHAEQSLARAIALKPSYAEWNKIGWLASEIERRRSPSSASSDPVNEKPLIANRLAR